MRILHHRIWLMACLVLAVQSAPCGAQSASEADPSVIQPRRISFSRSSRPITEAYVCIEPCNLLTAYAPRKTIFHELTPDSIGTFDTLETTKAIILQQQIKTTPLGNADLSEKAIGKDARKYPRWLWIGLVVTLSCSILGYILSVCFPNKKGPYFSNVQLGLIFGPLVPFLFLLLIFGFMSMVRSSVRDPKVDIYVDNATHNTYEITLNGEDVHLPPESHICLCIRPRDHDLRIREKSSGRETRYAVTSDFREGETYLINLERANRYTVERKSYTMY